METLANITTATELTTGQIVARGFTDNRSLYIQDNVPNAYQMEARTDGWRVATTEFGACWVRLTGKGKWSATWGTFAARVERCEMTTETVETEDGFAIVAGVGPRIGMAWVRVDGLAG
jgi:hypothetical protein